MSAEARRSAIECSSRWLRGLRVYLIAMAAGNLAWEAAHLPLYTIWQTGTPAYKVFAVVHCTLGDILIALSTIILALFIVGDERWPVRRYLPVAAVAIICGLGYTAFSEWHNVARGSWSYSAWMPVVRLFGTGIGLSPLLQWIVLPTASFAIVSKITVIRMEV